MNNFEFPSFSPIKGSKGVIYVVQDSDECLRECIFSAKSLKKFHPDWSITLFTNLKIENPNSYFDSVVESPIGLHPFKSKIFNIAASPYERTLFLDTDTQILQPIDELFDALKSNDLALAHEPYKDNFELCKNANDFANVNAFNTGVIAFYYKSNVYAFFKEWYTSIESQPDASLNYFNSDQDYFNKLVIKEGALNDLGIKLAVLDNKVYNVRTWIIKPLKEMGVFSDVRLLHHRGVHLTKGERIFRLIKRYMKWRK